jgi:hypothetical protein
MVQTAKKLLAMKGVLSSPNVKQGKLLPYATSELVKLFYLFHEISNIVPRTKRLCFF